MINLLEQIVTIHGQIAEVDDDHVIVEQAQFNKDFFPWKAGEEVALLQLASDSDGNVWLEQIDPEPDDIDHAIIARVQVELVSKFNQN